MKYPKKLCKRCGKPYDQKRFWQTNCGRKCQLESYYIRKANEVTKGDKNR